MVISRTLAPLPHLFSLSPTLPMNEGNANKLLENVRVKTRLQELKEKAESEKFDPVKRAASEVFCSCSVRSAFNAAA